MMILYEDEYQKKGFRMRVFKGKTVLDVKESFCEEKVDVLSKCHYTAPCFLYGRRR